MKETALFGSDAVRRLHRLSKDELIRMWGFTLGDRQVA